MIFRCSVSSKSYWRAYTRFWWDLWKCWNELLKRCSVWYKLLYLWSFITSGL